MADEETTAYESLSDRHRRFVDEYLRNGMNATRAYAVISESKLQGAELDHYLNTAGPRLMVNDGIKAAIREQMAEHAMGKEEVLQRLAMIARASVEDIAEVRDAFGKPTLRLTPGKALENGKGYIIKKAKEGPHGLEVELHDAHAALRDIGKHLGLFVDRHEISGPGGSPILLVPVDPTPDDG